MWHRPQEPGFHFPMSVSALKEVIRRNFSFRSAATVSVRMFNTCIAAAGSEYVYVPSKTLRKHVAMFGLQRYDNSDDHSFHFYHIPAIGPCTAEDSIAPLCFLVIVYGCA